MPISHIEHFLVQSTDIAATRDWYVRVLGFEEGWHPDFKFPVCWLYLGDRDVIHVTEGGAAVSENRKRYVGQESQATSGSGVIDHIAFRAAGLRETMAHLKRENVEFKARQVSDQGLYQLFLFDPNGIKIELNFANAEALEHGITPELMASDLPG
jgi:catechol 2,3-dioxygenase-like lactoylglutathione lyase family enzyme